MGEGAGSGRAEVVCPRVAWYSYGEGLVEMIAQNPHTSHIAQTIQPGVHSVENGRSEIARRASYLRGGLERRATLPPRGFALLSLAHGSWSTGREKKSWT